MPHLEHKVTWLSYECQMCAGLRTRSFSDSPLSSSETAILTLWMKTHRLIEVKLSKFQQSAVPKSEALSIASALSSVIVE